MKHLKDTNVDRTVTRGGWEDLDLIHPVRMVKYLDFVATVTNLMVR